MAWDHAPPSGADGNQHAPVMLAEVLDALAPQPGEVIVDGTFGGGGYTRAILASGASVIAIDRDPAAVARANTLATKHAGLTAVSGRFGGLDQHARDAGHGAVDGVVLDVGVSSYQLDQAERGFSFRFDAPLDMRMGGDGPTAADIVNKAEERDLAHLFKTFGEERRSAALARAIVTDRKASPFRTTTDLAGLCARVIRAGRDGIHPATRAFQALRIAVNDELAELARGLAAAEAVLKAGGRLVVVAFHSLEDRIVKRFLAERTRTGGGSRHMPAQSAPAPSFTAITRKALTPTDGEVVQNPRARSAKLRAARRTEAPAMGFNLEKLVPTVQFKGNIL